MAQAVIGLFKNPQDASEAKQRLVAQGFSSGDIDVSSSGITTGMDSSGSGTTGSVDRDNDESFGDKIGNFFKNLFGNDDDDAATKYSNVARKAGTLVTVHASSRDEAERAADILDDAGAADVDELANEYGFSAGSTSGSSAGSTFGGSTSDYGTASGGLGAGTAGLTSSGTSDYGTGSSTGLGTTGGSDYATTGSTGLGTTGDSDYSTTGTTGSGSTGASDFGSTGSSDLGTTGTSGYGSTGSSDLGTTGYTGTTGTSDQDQTLKVIQEDLQVGKREVVTGGVRLRSRIVERPVQEDLRLREENVTVERTSVDRVATDADFNAFKEGEIEMTERSEVPVVSKEARVVEEVRLAKDVNERVETISDTVRNTEVDVEKFDGDDVNTTRGTNS